MDSSRLLFFGRLSSLPSVRRDRSLCKMNFMCIISYCSLAIHLWSSLAYSSKRQIMSSTCEEDMISWSAGDMAAVWRSCETITEPRGSITSLSHGWHSEAYSGIRRPGSLHSRHRTKSTPSLVMSAGSTSGVSMIEWNTFSYVAEELAANGNTPVSVMYATTPIDHVSALNPS